MEQQLFIKGPEVNQTLSQLCSNKTPASMSYQNKGKWSIINVIYKELSDSQISFEINDPQKETGLKLQPDQPVGISSQDDEIKLMYDSTVTVFEASEQSTSIISIKIPDRIEKMPRRSYSRALVPVSLNVMVNFWHRGYARDCDKTVSENCWQGRLVDLSPGGMQVAIQSSQASDFSEGQLLGMQFTPSAYEMPITLEGHIKHIAQTGDGSNIHLGVEFLGLEASYDGREKLRKIVKTMDSYQQSSKNPLQETLSGLSIQ